MDASERTDNDNNKYKMFRNYMVNELGITRQDIESWTKQSVANEVQKLLGGINISELIATQSKQHISNALSNQYSNNTELVREVAKHLATKLTVKVSE